MERTYWVYILASRRNGTPYVGITGQLEQRIHLHRIGRGSEFTRKYGIRLLVHVESFSDVNDAIAREKAIKKWRRAWKLQLIERDNPTWRDLSVEVLGPAVDWVPAFAGMTNESASVSSTGNMEGST